MRRPKPAEIKLIEGNRGHRPIPKVPKPQRIYPDPPKWMKGRARKEWERIVPELYRLGLLTVIDQSSLEAYCVTYAKWRRASEKAKVTVSDGGKNNPYISIELKYLEIMRKYLIEFGMTPSSRTKVTTEKINPKKSEWDDILNAKQV